MSDATITVKRRVTSDEASSLVGTDVETDLTPTFRSPKDGDAVTVIDEDTGERVAVVSRLRPEHRRALRRLVTGMKYGQNVARQGGKKNMSVKGATFGYAPARPLARQEGCRSTATTRDNPDAAALLNAIASHLTAEFERLNPDRAHSDRDTLNQRIRPDWRLNGDSLWTSGVINQTTLLPYHRDGNNLDTWSAMPSVRYGMDGGHLHVPEYDLVFPVSDGDVSWFYGKRLVHGVTPMHRRRPDGYRYTVVFYAIQAMQNCRSYAEETRRAAAARTAREREQARLIREQLNLGAEPAIKAPDPDVMATEDISRANTCIPNEFDPDAETAP